jgi:hypothetical protein
MLRRFIAALAVVAEVFFIVARWWVVSPGVRAQLHDAFDSVPMQYPEVLRLAWIFATAGTLLYGAAVIGMLLAGRTWLKVTVGSLLCMSIGIVASASALHANHLPLSYVFEAGWWSAIVFACWYITRYIVMIANLTLPTTPEATALAGRPAPAHGTTA